MIGWCDGAGLGVLRIWIRVGQGPTALAVGTGVALLDIYHFLFFLPVSGLVVCFVWGLTAL